MQLHHQYFFSYAPDAVPCIFTHTSKFLNISLEGRLLPLKLERKLYPWKKKSQDQGLNVLWWPQIPLQHFLFIFHSPSNFVCSTKVTNMSYWSYHPVSWFWNFYMAEQKGVRFSCQRQYKAANALRQQTRVRLQQTMNCDCLPWKKNPRRPIFPTSLCQHTHWCYFYPTLSPRSSEWYTWFSSPMFITKTMQWDGLGSETVTGSKVTRGASGPNTDFWVQCWPAHTCSELVLNLEKCIPNFQKQRRKLQARVTLVGKGSRSPHCSKRIHIIKQLWNMFCGNPISKTKLL